MKIRGPVGYLDPQELTPAVRLDVLAWVMADGVVRLAESGADSSSENEAGNDLIPGGIEGTPSLGAGR